MCLIFRLLLGYPNISEFLAKLNESIDTASFLQGDNTSAILWVENVLSMRNVKHSKVWYQVEKYSIARETVILNNNNFSNYVADFFTKELDKNLFIKFRNLLCTKKISADAQKGC